MGGSYRRSIMNSPYVHQSALEYRTGLNEEGEKGEPPCSIYRGYDYRLDDCAAQTTDHITHAENATTDGSPSIVRYQFSRFPTAAMLCQTALPWVDPLLLPL